MIEVKNVYKGYNRTSVLKDISLTVVSGEIHGLIGENSAGKTTLIKCVAGIYKPEKGSILYDKILVYDNPDVKERVGYVADYNEYIRYYTITRMVHMYECFYPKFNKEKFNEYNRIFKLPVKKQLHLCQRVRKCGLHLC